MIDYAAILTANQRVLFMKVGIIGAMEQEVTLLRDQIENRQTIHDAKLPDIDAVHLNPP